MVYSRRNKKKLQYLLNEGAGNDWVGSFLPHHTNVVDVKDDYLLTKQDLIDIPYRN
jgi:hypothetical protein